MINAMNKINNELNELTNSLVEVLPVKKIFLFGSYAYGNPNGNSDIDLFVLIDDESDLKELKALQLAYEGRSKAKTLMPVDILVSKVGIFNRKAQAYGIQRDVASKGVCIYEKQ